MRERIQVNLQHRAVAELFHHLHIPRVAVRQRLSELFRLFSCQLFLQNLRAQTLPPQLVRLSGGARVKDYIVDIVLATRDPRPYGIDLNGYVQYGASPRATISLTLAARAHAFLQGRGYVTPQDIKDLAYDVLRHRIAVSYEAEAENITSENIIAGILEGLPVP